MHPLNTKNFGPSGIAVTFYNGSATVAGYIVKQLSQNRFIVTDGTVVKICYLAPTTSIATAIGSSNPDYFIIQVFAFGNGSGATFNPVFLPTVVTPQNGTNTGVGYSVGDVLNMTGNGGRLTVNTINGIGSILTATVSSQGGGSDLAPATMTTLHSGGAAFTGHMTGTTTLVVVSVSSGTIKPGQLLFGAGISNGTVIEGQSGGTTGGAGNYLLNRSFTIGFESMTSNGSAAIFNVGYILDHIEIDGSGIGYGLNDDLLLVGMVADILPTAFISSVDANGAPLSIAVTPGTNITTPPDSVTTTGPMGYVKSITERRLATTDGSSYFWSLGNSTDQSAFIFTFS